MIVIRAIRRRWPATRGQTKLFTITFKILYWQWSKNTGKKQLRLFESVFQSSNHPVIQQSNQPIIDSQMSQLGTETGGCGKGKGRLFVFHSFTLERCPKSYSPAHWYVCVNASLLPVTFQNIRRFAVLAHLQIPPFRQRKDCKSIQTEKRLQIAFCKLIKGLFI